MKQTQLPHLLLNHSKDLFWMIDLNFQLIYANTAYLSLMKKVTGVEKKLNESIFVEGFGEGYIKKWKGYYSRAIAGEYFEIEEHIYHPESNEIQYSQITFAPILNGDDNFFAVACQSKDITRIVKQKSEANQLIDASLDVFCTVNEQGNFLFVSSACEKLWGYLPAELIGTSYRDLILEEDLAKTNETITSLLSGEETKSFRNRYKKKDGGIAYNLWSARWDDTTKLRYAVAKDCKEIIEQEERILQSEQRFKALVQEGSDMIAILDSAGVYTYVSPAATNMLGILPEAFIGRNILEMIHPDDAAILLPRLQKIKTESKVILATYRLQNYTKEWRWFETKFTNMLHNPIVNGIVVNSRDFTEEKKLRELNQQVNSLAKIGSWEVDLVNQTIFWSNEVHQMHETDPKSFVPNLEIGIKFFREDFRSLIQLNFEKCIATEAPFDFEAVLVTAKKKERWVRSIGNGEFVDGKCVRIYGSFQDINDRKEAENRVLAISDNLPGLIFQYIIYPDGTDAVKYVSKMAQQIWGFSAAEVLQNVQLVWDGVVAGGGIEAFQKSIANAIASKTKWTTKWKYVLPSGEIKTLQGYASPNFLADGTVVFNSVIFDVTQEAVNEALLVQYTHELERSNEELEQFAFVASHDLQEPLRMISSFMDLLKRRYGNLLDEKGHEYIHFAIDGAMRMKQIILDLLKYSRASRPSEGKETVDLNELVAEFCLLRKKLIDEKKASISAKNLPRLNTYKAAITQILHCLLDNALKYSVDKTPPIIEINAVENETVWEFSIKDNGIGIGPEYFQKIFIIFQRLHNMNEYSGTGIGLSIAKRQVEFLGGKIWLESVPGEGSVFYFTIPTNK